VVLLMLFALVAGAGTALSPCVLPILPAVLSVGVTGGRRRPLGVVTGLALSFTFATVALVYVIDALGLPDDIARTLAIVVLAVFGISLLVPSIGDRIEAWLSRIAPAPARTGGEGFGSGLLLGASLGLVYAPCAGPILAGVITVSAAQDFTAGRLAVALSYAVGSAIVLYALLLGGRRLADRLKPIRGQVQMAMGAVMVCVAVVMAADLDTRFQTAIASDLPSFLVNPTGDLEEDEAVSDELSDVRGGGEGIPSNGPDLSLSGRLPVLGLAPEFAGIEHWLNTDDGEPLTMSGLRGQVVLIDFWTYTCINCIRTLPYVEAWDREYGDRGLTIVGVHSPEFSFEKDTGNVEDAIEQNGLTYPVAQDNELGTWSAYGNQYWPAKSLVDAEGQVRYIHYGEGEYEATESAIRTLLTEAGESELGSGARASVETVSAGVTTPETYLGALRADGWTNLPRPTTADELKQTTGRHDFGDPPTPGSDQFSFGGVWEIDQESATAGPGAAIEADFHAEKVFLVLGSPDRARRVRVLLDGRPIPNRLAGEDVRGGVATVSAQRLYRLVDLPAAGSHRLTLRFAPGISGYAFTFG
jgi:cytochrome c biogenesis protein CcdA/thiol-disulfide isomerase/thioredoxin